MKKTILIVEDDPDMIQMYKEMLGTGFNIESAHNTASAMKYLNKNLPDLMILDVIMPKESGEVFYKRIKAMPRYKDLKVLVITVLGDVSDYFQSIDPTAQCLPKPFGKQSLLMKIQEMIGK